MVSVTQQGVSSRFIQLVGRRRIDRLNDYLRKPTTHIPNDITGQNHLCLLKNFLPPTSAPTMATHQTITVGTAVATMASWCASAGVARKVKGSAHLIPRRARVSHARNFLGQLRPLHRSKRIQNPYLCAQSPFPPDTANSSARAIQRMAMQSLPAIRS